jgi:hypothetical protein
MHRPCPKAFHTLLRKITTRRGAGGASEGVREREDSPRLGELFDFYQMMKR